MWNRKIRKFFAFENAKIKPDIVPIAKGIGGGFPLGAVLMNKKVSNVVFQDLMEVLLVETH